MIFVSETCPHIEYVVLIEGNKYFHIVLFNDKLFLPYCLCSIDAHPIMECIDFYVTPYICHDFFIRYIPIYRMYVLMRDNKPFPHYYL